MVTSSEWRKLCLTTFVVTLAVVYQLYKTALNTGNFEGFWFSLAHTLIVGAGVLLALRKSS